LSEDQGIKTLGFFKGRKATFSARRKSLNNIHIGKANSFALNLHGNFHILSEAPNLLSSKQVLMKVRKLL
jgi:hypothetical protein